MALVSGGKSTFKIKTKWFCKIVSWRRFLYTCKFGSTQKNKEIKCKMIWGVHKRHLLLISAPVVPGWDRWKRLGESNRKFLRQMRFPQVVKPSRFHGKRHSRFQGQVLRGSAVVSTGNFLHCGCLELVSFNQSYSYMYMKVFQTKATGLFGVRKSWLSNKSQEQLFS